MLVYPLRFMRVSWTTDDHSDAIEWCRYSYRGVALDWVIANGRRYVVCALAPPPSQHRYQGVYPAKIGGRPAVVVNNPRYHPDCNYPVLLLGDV